MAERSSRGRLARLNTRLRTGPLPGTVNTVSDVPERWTKASVYPDMWADPARIPRDSAGVSPDGELATLQDYDGELPADPADEVRRAGPGAAGVPVGAAVDHVLTGPDPSSCRGGTLLAQLDRVGRPSTQAVRGGRRRLRRSGCGAGAGRGAFADLAREQAATDGVLAGYPDLSTRVGRKGIAVRELWVHRIEEYARHCGHADLLRERIDGRVGQSPPKPPFRPAYA